MCSFGVLCGSHSASKAEQTSSDSEGMLLFRSMEQNRCCLCCGHCWSRCCTTASKRAIEDSMVRELCWILHGETCAELQDVQKKHDAQKRASVTDKIGSKGNRSRSGENMYDKNHVHPTSRTGTESQMIQIKNRYPIYTVLTRGTML